MKRCLALVAVGCLALLAASCTENYEGVGASVAVERLIDGKVNGVPGKCFARCSASEAVAEELTQRCDPTTSAGNGGATGAGDEVVADCGFSSGVDSLRVSVNYHVDVATSTALVMPTMKIVNEDASTESTVKFAPVQRKVSNGRSRPLVAARLPAASNRLGSLGFEVTIPNGVVISTGNVFSVVSPPAPSIFVEKWQGRCFAPCEGSAPVPADLDLRCVLTAEEIAAGVPEAVSCGLVAGVDQYRISIEYGVDVPVGTTLAQPGLKLIGDDASLDSGAKFIFPSRAAVGEFFRPLAVARLRAPSTPFASLRLEATVPNGIVVSTDEVFSVVKAPKASPSIAVEKLIAGAKGPCFAPCEGSAAVSANLDLRCKLTAQEIAAGKPETATCGLAAGADLYRVSIDYGADVPVGTTLTQPSLKLIGDDASLDSGAKFTFPTQPAHNDMFRPLAVARLRAPLTPFAVLELEATLPGDLVPTTGGILSVQSAAPTLRFDACSDCANCVLPSGVGSVGATLTAPVGFAGKQATFSSTVSGFGELSLANPTKTLLATPEGVAEGTIKLDVAPGIGRVWTVSTQLEGLEASCRATLRQPDAPLLAVGALGSRPSPTSSQIPARVLGEPSADCRSYDVSVEVPDPPSNRVVTLRSTVGNVGGKALETSLALNLEDKASSRLVLPDSNTSPLIDLSLIVDAQRAVTLPIRLRPMLPLIGVGSLVAAQRALTIADTGTPNGVALRGTVQVIPGTKFAAGSTLVVRTRVISGGTESGLSCGTTVDPSIVTCDQAAANLQDRGGCFLVPATVPLNPDGTYTISLASGLCFTGEVEITVFSYVYISTPAPGSCIGELETSSSPQAVGSLNLKFSKPTTN